MHSIVEKELNSCSLPHTTKKTNKQIKKKQNVVFEVKKVSDATNQVIKFCETILRLSGKSDLLI